MSRIGEHLANKRLVVTGGTGFLGKHLQEVARAEGLQQARFLGSREYDLTDPAEARRLVGEECPDILVHAAAVCGGIGANRAEPGRFFYANAVMGVHLIEEARRAGVEKFVQLGTVCSYPKNATPPFREDGLWDGYPEETNAPYGVAKKMLLVQLQAYREQYGFNGVYLIPVNLYGPYDNFDLETSHVIPALIRRFDDAMRLGYDSVTLWGDGTPSREFLHARDAARGILLAAALYNEPEPVNLGTGREITIRELAELVAREVGYTGGIAWDTSKPNGQPRRRLDTTRAKARFGFEAQVPLEEGIAETVAWYRSAPAPIR
ncbi:MAG: GDP-fucose synthetase [Armatimonadota bacterium]